MKKKSGIRITRVAPLTTFQAFDSKPTEAAKSAAW